MEDTHKHANPKSAYEKAQELCTLLENHKADDVAVLDFRELSFWTDFFVLGTIHSRAHLAGVKRALREYGAAHGFAAPRKSAAIKPPSAYGPAGAAAAETIEWDLSDLGGVVVHLMNRAARDFYEIERLWNTAVRIQP